MIKLRNLLNLRWPITKHTLPPPGPCGHLHSLQSHPNQENQGSSFNIHHRFNDSIIHHPLINDICLCSGLEFLPTSEESSACRGLHEASLVSVSVDHQVDDPTKVVAIWAQFPGVRAQCEQPIHYVVPGGDDPCCPRSPSHLCPCQLPGTLVLLACCCYPLLI